ncbi:hypothetical protein Slin15195_G015330 [Septoria linicola]|uniref:Uncharacterized protein n=1 Tax=Septoria linicola TaxID=215465 RepID=A0A9Q9AEZ2_9PEZI|nr:hypothetical protein Slin15195_G015330 [Septoria linicola]
MVGFTAINASASDRLPPPAAPAALVTRSEQEASRCTAQHVRETDAVSAVSEYLGIGHYDSKIVPAVIPHLQKASKKSRRGVTDAQQGRQSKRHKSNNTLSTTLQISEPAKGIAAEPFTSLAETNNSLHADPTSSRSERKPVMETCAMSGNMTDSQANGAISSTRNCTNASVHRPPRKAKADAIQKNSDLLCGRRSAQQTAHITNTISTGQPHRRRRSTADTFTADDSIEVSDADTSMPVQLSYTSPEELTQDAFEDELDDSILIDLAEAVEEDAKDSRRTPPPRNYKQNLREVDEHEDYGGALLSASERTFLRQHTSISPQGQRPIVRQAFPQLILDRSPIAGATRSTTLRTCFRLGEALNVGSQAVRTNTSIVIELYARVMSSWREPQPGRKQHFVFADLYHDKAPQVDGTFELFNQASLWDLDSQTFLPGSASGSMCRAMVRMKRDTQQKWRFEVLSIWQASWEDVNTVWGIIDG